MCAAIESYPRSRDRAMDITQLKTYTQKIFNDMRDNIHDLPIGQTRPDDPDVWFILGGYSWIKKKFQLWKLKFNKNDAKFEYSSMLKSTKNKVAVIGDYVGEFQKRLNILKKERNWAPQSGLDMEPFEVLRDMLLDSKQKGTDGIEKFPLIGGAPQIVKIYQHLNSRPLAVNWPDRKGNNRVHLFGRPLMNYENTNWWVLDPNTLRSSHLYYSNIENDAN